jgi:hypothetical protein
VTYLVAGPVMTGQVHVIPLFLSFTRQTKQTDKPSPRRTTFCAMLVVVVVC